jgi:ABC-type lipoprotein release transport system permease subunit
MSLSSTYRIFLLFGTVAILPCVALGGRLSMLVMLALASVALVMDGILTAQLLKSGSVEVNPLMRRLVSKLGRFNSILTSRIIGIVCCVAFAFLNSTPALLLVFTVTTVACSINILSLPRNKDHKTRNRFSVSLESR